MVSPRAWLDVFEKIKNVFSCRYSRYRPNEIRYIKIQLVPHKKRTTLPSEKPVS
jgi:hypothetical protein